MTRSEFVQKAAIAIHSQSVSPDVRRTWQEAEALAAAFPGVWETPTQNAAPKASGGGGGGMTFPNFGATKNEPIHGANEKDIRYYAKAALRTLADESKSRWHDKSRAELAAYVNELERQGKDASEFAQRKEDDGRRAPPMAQTTDPLDDGSDVPF